MIWIANTFKLKNWELGF